MVEEDMGPLSFGYLESERSIRQPNRNVRMIVRYASFQFGRAVRLKCIHLRVVGIEMALKAMRLKEITKGVSIDREGQGLSSEKL